MRLDSPLRCFRADSLGLVVAFSRIVEYGNYRPDTGAELRFRQCQQHALGAIKPFAANQLDYLHDKTACGCSQIESRSGSSSWLAGGSSRSIIQPRAARPAITHMYPFTCRKLQRSPNMFATMAHTIHPASPKPNARTSGSTALQCSTSPTQSNRNTRQRNNNNPSTPVSTRTFTK